MRLLDLIYIMALSTNVHFSEDFQRFGDKKNQFVANGDVIEATLFHENGAVAQMGFYTKDNKLTGEWVSYDTAGNKTAVAQYDNGSKVGTWVFFDGDLNREVTYTDSRISNVNTWEKKDSRFVSNE